jgi:fatty-acyl-CoA synthase
MLGLMQDWPLLTHKIIDYAALQYGGREVVTRTVEGPIHRTDYVGVRARSLRVAQRLARDGIKLGDRVATLAWNTVRHLEAWYGIGGIGAVYHTVNPRLFPEQIAWIVNHAEDRVIMTDLTFVPVLETLADRLPAIERYIVLTDAAHMPATKLKNAVAYETWLAEADGDFRWAEFDELTAAGLCYTSGTTGNPKGVLYSHRSNTLQSLGLVGPDMFALSSRDTCMPVVPLFHANSWSLAFSCPMMGAKMVMPGPKLDGASICELLEGEAVTFSAGVPTVWLALLQHLETTGKTLSTLQRLAIGGSACPRMLMEALEKRYGVRVCHAWGMTEMSPVGTIGSVKPGLERLAGDALYDLKQKQGFAFFGVEMKVTDDAGHDLPWDGKTFGRLKTRGFAVARAYYRNETPILDEAGYFDTGDIATIDPHGYMQITDRSKDVIKSGGEWISSIEIENLAVGHVDVAEAAVIGIVHPRWDERPLLVVVPKAGRTVEPASVLKFLDGKIAKWWMPNDVQVVGEIPHTATGKINKLKLRETFRDYRFPVE